MRDEVIRRSLYENVADGRVKIVGERDGEHLFAITDDGVARVHRIVDSFRVAHGADAAPEFARELEVPVEIAGEIIARSLHERGLT